MEDSAVTHRRPSRFTYRQKGVYIRQWRKSGLSKRAFCETGGINYYTFVGWTAPKKKKKAPPASASGFIPVTVKEISVSPFAEVVYANGSRIIFHEAVKAGYLRDMTK